MKRMKIKSEDLIKELKREKLDFDLKSYSDALTLQLDRERIESDG